MKAQLSTANPTADYSVQTLQLPSGTVVHEYASATGTVFAVTWSGPSLPDLSTVLGAYLSDYVAAAAAPYHDHHHVAISSTDLVVQSSGRMGSFSGRAYVPSLLPPNVSASDIQ